MWTVIVIYIKDDFKKGVVNNNNKVTTTDKTINKGGTKPFSRNN